MHNIHQADRAIRGFLYRQKILYLLEIDYDLMPIGKWSVSNTRTFLVVFPIYSLTVTIA